MTRCLYPLMLCLLFSTRTYATDDCDLEVPFGVANVPKLTVPGTTSVFVSLPAERKHKTLTEQFEAGAGVTLEPAATTLSAGRSVELHIAASNSASLGLQAITIRGKETNQECARMVLYYAFPTLWSGDHTNAEINNLVTQYGGVALLNSVVVDPLRVGVYRFTYVDKTQFKGDVKFSSAVNCWPGLFG